MLRTIEIKGRTGRIDVPSFLLTENEELTLKISTKEIRVGRYVLGIKLNDKKRVEYLGKDMMVALSQEWLNAAGSGVMEFTLEFRSLDGAQIIIPSAKSETDKSAFFIEPLLIEKMDDSFTVVGWLKKIEESQEQTNSAVAELKAKLAEFEDNGVPLVFEEENE